MLDMRVLRWVLLVQTPPEINFLVLKSTLYENRTKYYAKPQNPNRPNVFFWLRPLCLLSAVKPIKRPERCDSCQAIGGIL